MQIENKFGLVKSQSIMIIHLDSDYKKSWNIEDMTAWRFTKLTGLIEKIKISTTHITNFL